MTNAELAFIINHFDSPKILHCINYESLINKVIRNATKSNVFMKGGNRKLVNEDSFIKHHTKKAVSILSLIKKYENEILSTPSLMNDFLAFNILFEETNNYMQKNKNLGIYNRLQETYHPLIAHINDLYQRFINSISTKDT